MIDLQILWVSQNKEYLMIVILPAFFIADINNFLLFNNYLDKKKATIGKKYSARWLLVLTAKILSLCSSTDLVHSSLVWSFYLRPKLKASNHFYILNVLVKLRVLLSFNNSTPIIPQGGAQYTSNTIKVFPFNNANIKFLFPSKAKSLPFKFKLKYSNIFFCK